MDINGAFPSTYLKTADLQGQRVPVQIAHVRVEPVGQGKDQEDLPIVYFQGKQKGMVLNKTNANTIAAAYGPETDMWTGQTITLYPTTTDFAGRTVPCLRVDCGAAAPQQAPAEPAFDARQEVGATTGDNIPF